MKNTAKGEKHALDPTDPRQVAFISGGITGTVAGAAVGSLAGPVGTVVGTALGGLMGATAAENIAIDTAAENAYWENTWKERPYTHPARTYEDYAPAFRAGYTIVNEVFMDDDDSFESTEGTVRRRYEEDPAATLPWEEVRPAAREAFQRVMAIRQERLRGGTGEKP